MENLIEQHQKLLYNYRGFSVPSHVIDYFYKEGYITDEDYKKCYDDSKYIPELVNREVNDLAKELEYKCIREGIREHKVKLEHDRNKMKRLYDLH